MKKVNKNANFYLAVLIAAIFAIALIFAITSGNSVKSLKAGSPEETVQKYLQALNNGQNEEAAALFSSTNICRVDDVDRAYVDDSLQILLDKVTYTNETSAVVHLSIQSSDGPLMSDPYVQKETIRLIKENGVWKINGDPWPIYSCEATKP